MGRDKKVAGGAIRFILLQRLGHAVVRTDVSATELATSLIH